MGNEGGKPLFECEGSGCNNWARSKPYAEGFFCRRCHRAMSEPRAPKRYVPPPLQGAAARRALEAKTPAPWLRPAAGKKTKTSTLAHTPPGPLRKSKPGWWETDDRW
ncbi:hypothetical protein GCM10015536_72000 [Streptomyces griseomycini]|nr:hypothetical protein GCM10015536_72000 [Streptomyces griseomycini]